MPREATMTVELYLAELRSGKADDRRGFHLKIGKRLFNDIDRSRPSGWVCFYRLADRARRGVDTRPLAAYQAEGLTHPRKIEQKRYSAATADH
jgi:hypothetical protein